MTLADFTAEYSGDALIITNSTNNTQLSAGTVLSSSEMQDLVGSGWEYFTSGGTWYIDVSSTYVGTLWDTAVVGDPFTWQEHIVFDGTAGSTLYDTVTVTDWGDNIAYILNMTLTVYSGAD